MKKPVNAAFLFQTGLLILAMIGSGTAFSAQPKGQYEKPPVRKAGEVLTPALIKGKTFHVLDPVTNFESLNKFKVKTNWGTFDIYSEPLLRVRLKEFEAIDHLQKKSSAGVAVRAAGDEAAKSVISLGKAIAHPVDTAKGIPGGIRRMFKSIRRDRAELVKAGKDAAVERDAGGAVKLARKYAGISKPYREWSQAMGVDPYTTNPLLIKELNRIAAVEAAARLGTGFVVPALPGALGLVADVSSTVYEKDWRDLFDENRKDMQSMGVSPKVIAKFEDRDALTPSMMTLIVKSLASMSGVKDRRYVIGQAALLESEVQALFFTECVMLAHWYHHQQKPLKRMLLETLIPVGLSVDSRVIAFSAADYAYWDRLNESIAVEFTQKYRKYSPRREAWVADLVSARFIKGMKGLGWTVHFKIRQSALPEIPWGLQDTNKTQ